ncbi:TetR/AcrR family transcriptional regulator [Marinobacteraceae bacterium S3BR75-40.1]
MTQLPEVSSQEEGLTDPNSARGRILTRAARLFREKGYERTTVRDLAAAVGIQSGSIFHHFPNKEAILRAVMEDTIRLNTARMRLALQQAATPHERLRALIRCELESINGETGEAMAVLVYEWRSLSEVNQKDILRLRDVYEDLWMGVLTELGNSGQIDADPFFVRRFLTGALSWTITWYRPGGDMDLDDLSDEVLRTLRLSPK